MDKILLNPIIYDDPTHPIDPNLQKLIELLKQEALSFIANNSSNIFNLSSDLVKAILFKNLYSYVEIPPLKTPDDLNEVVEREKLLASRDCMFQLVAKAELQNYQATQTLISNAEIFILSVLKIAGSVGVSFLTNYLLGLIL